MWCSTEFGLEFGEGLRFQGLTVEQEEQYRTKTVKGFDADGHMGLHSYGVCTRNEKKTEGKVEILVSQSSYLMSHFTLQPPR